MKANKTFFVFYVVWFMLYVIREKLRLQNKVDIKTLKYHI